MVARVALATSATITVVEFAKNSAKTTRNVTKILLQNFLQFCNVTVSCVGYFLPNKGRKHGFLETGCDFSILKSTLAYQNS